MCFAVFLLGLAIDEDLRFPIVTTQMQGCVGKDGGEMQWVQVAGYWLNSHLIVAFVALLRTHLNGISLAVAVRTNLVPPIAHIYYRSAVACSISDINGRATELG